MVVADGDVACSAFFLDRKRMGAAISFATRKGAGEETCRLAGDTGDIERDRHLGRCGYFADVPSLIPEFES